MKLQELSKIQSKIAYDRKQFNIYKQFRDEKLKKIKTKIELEKKQNQGLIDSIRSSFKTPYPEPEDAQKNPTDSDENSFVSEDISPRKSDEGEVILASPQKTRLSKSDRGIGQGSLFNSLKTFERTASLDLRTQTFKK